MNGKLISIGTLLAALALGTGTFLVMRHQNSSTTAGTTATTTARTATCTPTNGDKNVTELIKTDTVVGTGAEATAGKKISVHYTGCLLDGTKFDSSVDRGQPFSFTLGQGQVIKGWDQGFDGMKVGGKRTLTIPAEMAYGAGGQGSIPPNSPLKFDVELLGVE